MDKTEKRFYTFHARKRGALGVATQSFAILATDKDDAWYLWTTRYGNDWEPLRFGGAFGGEQ